MRPNQIGNFVRPLVCHQTAGNFGVRLVGQHRLHPIPLKTTPHPIDFQRRPRPTALIGSVAWLAIQGRNLQVGHKLGFVIGNFGNLGAVIIRKWHHVVKKALHQNFAVGAPHGGQNVGEGVERVGNCPPINPRMQIPSGSLYVNLQRRQPFGAKPDTRLAFAPLAAIGANDIVTAKFVLVSGNKRRQMGAANLFLPFKEAFDVHGQAAATAKQGFHCHNGHKHVAFVVGSTACGNTAVFDHRVKRVTRPQVEGVNRLHVKMAVN